MANADLKGEVKRLETAKQELNNAQKSLSESNEKTKQNLVKFKKLSDNLELMGKNASVLCYLTVTCNNQQIQSYYVCNVPKN